MKKTGTILAAFCALALLVSCSGKQEAKVAKKKAYFISVRVGGAAWSLAQKGFEAAVKELGWEGTYVAPTTANDTSQMANLFETAITQKSDVILGCFYMKDVFSGLITKARDKKIIVGNVNVNLGGIENFQIGTDQSAMGEAQAKALADIAAGRPCKVVYLVQSLDNEIIRVAYNAFQTEIAKHPNIKIHGLETDDNNPVTAADKLKNLVKAHPDINGVICTNSSGASLGVANYVEENKLQEKFYTVGIDASADILNYVKSGALSCTLDQDFYKMGYESVYMAKKVMEGGTVPYKNDSGMIRVMKADVDAYAIKKGLDLTKKK